MADNLDLAIRIRADLQSALNGLKQMEGDVAGVDREIRKASFGARIFRSTIGQLVSGDLIARGIIAIARSARQFAVETVQAGGSYPRSRGEHNTARELRASAAGSSPLARGTLSRFVESRGSHRFIPARAGNTSSFLGLTGAIPVHPRSRGEHSRFGDIPRLPAGSSPLARGTLSRFVESRGSHRFIPARAGNTSSFLGLTGAIPVHPRSRGEHDYVNGTGDLDVGSSPLARGTPRHRGRRDALHRFIPARAGNTDAATAAGITSTVHPRSRGEHPMVSSPMDTRPGSSPLARGTRL